MFEFALIVHLLTWTGDVVKLDWEGAGSLAECVEKMYEFVDRQDVVGAECVLDVKKERVKTQ